MADASLTTRPYLLLTLSFTVYKSLLLLIAACASIGPAYDTSTSLFLELLYGADTQTPLLARQLTRWDALYFMHSAKRGYVHEQEWAFGMGVPLVVNGVQYLATMLGLGTPSEPVVAIALAHVSHFVAVLALYELTMTLSSNRRISVVAALLHIISPAGLFLSAPYAEAPYSCLSFVGNLLFVKGLGRSPCSSTRAVFLIAAGASFGLSSVFRSNGILSGILFAVEAVNHGLPLLRRPSLCRLAKMIAPIAGGLLVAAGTIGPQAVAWWRYCGPGKDVDVEPRPWCERAVPSIFTFVQAEYWDVGFLTYWTLNQLPLFLLASPVLAILLTSSTNAIRDPNSVLAPRSAHARLFIQILACIQGLLAILAILIYHVQIITRISSGYPLWYWWVASCLADEKRRSLGSGIVMFMVMYGTMQGGLFASFLPPA